MSEESNADGDAPLLGQLVGLGFIGVAFLFAIISFAGSGRLIWSFASSYLKGTFPSIYQSHLDKVLVLNRATSEQFRTYIEDGGLRTDNHWRGFAVSGVVPYFTGAGYTLSAMKLQIDAEGFGSARNGTIRDIKNSIVDECGVKWNRSGDIYQSVDGTFFCYMEVQDDRGCIILTIAQLSGEAGDSATSR